ncbi:unnamed protein product [Phytomonas sp. EM1]|nr:unnamed protein product [Phytomonas sp. EM1]|eukprot:CCW64813.1 unnamed protein product [Phytomonas sp. isolate EM1]
MPDKQPTETIKVFFVLGGPGSGKTTACVHLVETFGYTHYSAGDLLRQASRSRNDEAAKVIRSYMISGNIVPDETTVNLIHQAIKSNPNPNGYLIDGFPRTIRQGQMFEESIAPAAGVIYLNCSDETMEKRLQARGQEQGDNKREDDVLEVIRNRLRVHHAQCEPVIETYKAQGRCHVVDSNQNPDKVCDDLRKLLLSLGEKSIRDKAK